MKRGEQPLTDEQLQLAFRQLRRPGWPATLEEARRNPVRDKCIQGLARQLSRVPFGAHARPARTPAGAPPVPPTPSEAPSRKPAAYSHHHNRVPALDLKRAAANDRD